MEEPLHKQPEQYLLHSLHSSRAPPISLQCVFFAVIAESRIHISRRQSIKNIVIFGRFENSAQVSLFRLGLFLSTCYRYVWSVDQTVRTIKGVTVTRILLSEIFPCDARSPKRLIHAIRYDLLYNRNKTMRSCTNTAIRDRHRWIAYSGNSCHFGSMAR
jgi:hypothetical protein